MLVKCYQLDIYNIFFRLIAALVFVSAANSRTMHTVQKYVYHMKTNTVYQAGGNYLEYHIRSPYLIQATVIHVKIGRPRCYLRIPDH